MIRENEFVRISAKGKSPKEAYEIRLKYRNFSKKQKKSISRHITKFKQNMDFKQWWTYISSRIKDGHEIHKQNRNNWLPPDPKIEELKKEVKTKKFKEYHKLK